MTTADAIIRAAIPDADDDTVDYVLWGRTPYPFGPVTPRSLYKAASGLARAGRKGIELCEWCDRPATDKGCDGCRGPWS